MSKDLIPITKAVINNEEQNCVQARELHKKLESKRQFSNWITYRIEQAELKEDKDFIMLIDSQVVVSLPKTNLFKGGNNVYSKLSNGRWINKNNNNFIVQVDYLLTLDSAKHVALLEETEIGRKVRNYFIEVEKSFIKLKREINEEEFKDYMNYKDLMNKVPKTYKEALLLAANQQEEIERLEIDNRNKEIEIKQAQPKVEFYDAVAESSDAISIGDTAKILNIKGVGRNNLFEFLRDKEILMKDNRPYQRFVDNGWFRTIEQKFQKPDGSTHINIKTLVYQRGLDEIRKLVNICYNELKILN